MPSFSAADGPPLSQPQPAWLPSAGPITSTPAA